MSITAAQRVRLGIFMIAGLFILAVFIAIPLGLKFTTKSKTYVAFFEGESLSGLEQGANVKFNGVPVGKVQKITYFPENLDKMKVILEVDADFPMKVDMHATTGAMGITGLKYIEISGGSNESQVLKSGSEIPTRTSMMANITGKAEVIAEKVELLLNQLNTITHPDSLRSIKTIVDNVATMSTDAKTFFGDVTPKVDRMASSSEELITQVTGITQDVKQVTGRFSDNVKGDDLAAILTRADSTALSMKNLSDQLSLMVMQTREDFSVSMENLRETAENANQLTRMLSENPSLLLKSEQRERVIR
ncbi:MAG: MlaD family protein [Chitinispirillaceae bacterium]